MNNIVRITKKQVEKAKVDYPNTGIQPLKCKTTKTYKDGGVTVEVKCDGVPYSVVSVVKPSYVKRFGSKWLREYLESED